MNLLIIGGSDAGMSAALRAREIDSSSDITVLLADSFPNYSICDRSISAARRQIGGISHTAPSFLGLTFCQTAAQNS